MKQTKYDDDDLEAKRREDDIPNIKMRTINNNETKKKQLKIQKITTSILMVTE